MPLWHATTKPRKQPSNQIPKHFPIHVLGIFSKLFCSVWRASIRPSTVNESKNWFRSLQGFAKLDETGACNISHDFVKKSTKSRRGRLTELQAWV